MEIHKLLQKQIKKHLPDVDLNQSSLSEFLTAINQSYLGFERDMELMNHAFLESEKEYNQINKDLKDEYELKKQSIAKLYESLKVLQEGFEIVRNIRDNNVEKGRFWSSGLSDCASGCQADYKTETTAALPVNYLNNYRDEFLKLNADGFYSYDRNGNESVYKRKITITQPSGSDMLKVLVEVFWNYNNQSYRVENVGYLYRFNR